MYAPVNISDVLLPLNRISNAKWTAILFSFCTSCPNQNKNQVDDVSAINIASAKRPSQTKKKRRKSICGAVTSTRQPTRPYRIHFCLDANSSVSTRNIYSKWLGECKKKFWLSGCPLSHSYIDRTPFISETVQCSRSLCESAVKMIMAAE